MNQSLLVDTDVLIDAGRGIEIAINKLELTAKNYNMAISAITNMELIVGCCNKNELQNLERFLLNSNSNYD